MTMTQYLCRIATTLMFFGALFGSQAAMAKDWPTQPIRIVLPYPPGGASDVTARLLGMKMSQAWGTTVVIDRV